MDLTIDRENQFGMASTAGRAEHERAGSTAGRRSLRRLEPVPLHPPADPTDSDAQRLRARHPRPGLPGSENLLGTGISIPAFGVLINALAAPTTPTSSPRRTSWRPTTSRRDQRRPEHPPADQLGGFGGASRREAPRRGSGALGALGGSRAAAGSRRGRTSAPRSRSFRT
jgi:hypothetical protein